MDKEPLRLNAANVPEQFRQWIPLAEKWGIGDDFLRAQVLNDATHDELRELLTFGEQFNEVAEWLAGPESYSASPTDEYIAFSDLAAAWEVANLRAKRSKNSN